MKKLVLTMVSAFVLSALGASAHACDGMKGHAKGDKGDQTDQPSTSAKKDGKAKADQKS